MTLLLIGMTLAQEESGQRHFAPGHSEHPVSDRVFGMTFCPGQLSLRTPCLFFLMPGVRNEHVIRTPCLFLLMPGDRNEKVVRNVYFPKNH